jgi:outer membrane protein assembly factor BamE
MKNFKILLCIILACLLAACSSKLLTVHKIDVQQGNALEAEMVDKVEIGMTQEQVHYVLGSPLITDSFHPYRWDYIYLFRPGYGEKVRRQLTLTFDRGEVIDIDKQNIAKSDTGITPLEDDIDKTKKEVQKKERLTEKNQKELKEAEKQADALKDVLQENKNPGK